MFGNNERSQIPYTSVKGGMDYKLEMCCPMEIDLGMAEGERIVKIKAGMNRSAVFTSKGRCLVFGGREDSPSHCNTLLTKN
jgi:hypothetical protein